MMNKKNQFSQTEGVRVMDASTQTEEEVETMIRHVDNKETTKKLDESKEGEDRLPRYRYALLVKKGTEDRESSLELKRVEDKERQDIEAEDKEEIKESGTIYSYAITEGKSMKRGDTKDKHSTLFH